ncbi:M4 family metallopeptidase [Knoellia subterranea]|uniref:Neutral metalloproteinase n=1 Tax=Knoellia subterranea KCTC 19937 TaxID=1385521 RepID=A0A0A0JR96_9MICO|nr:M4 family metallopeptidase [Knoellia subterranea]KGN38542.1 peptidase [Knoellia subterranea KCTC 19937]
MRRSLSVLACLAAGSAAIATVVPAASARPADPIGPLRQLDVASVGASAEQALRAAPGLLRLAAGEDLIASSALGESSGARHVRMNRTYAGLPVLGGDLVAHLGADGAVDSVSQTLRAPLTVSTTPKITSAKARQATRPTLPAGVNLDKAAPTLAVDATDGTPRLVWDVRASGVRENGTPSRLHTWVDATTGAVVGSADEIHEADGSGSSLYSGTVTIQTTQSGSSYQLKDTTRGNSQVTDMGNKTDSIFCQILQIGCSAGTLYTDADNVWGTGSNFNRQTAAVDAAYGQARTWDYFKNAHGRNGIWNTGQGSPSRVHYGSNYVNAFWDGKQMTYGDGDGSSFGPLVSLDVAGHEMSHGVIENSANLTYSKESGGLNESTSDIFGTMVEFSANNPNDPGDYLIGEEFDLAKGLGFRRMDNPSSDGSSVNCWSSSVANLDVHYSSGVGNHFFYLLAEGSGAKTFGGKAHNSTTCNGTTISGIGRDAAAKIWYRALTVYMTSSTNYSGARAATVKAAGDLYGASSTQAAAVAKAWDAVSVK